MHIGFRFEKWWRLVEISSHELVSQLTKAPLRLYLRQYLHLQCFAEPTADPCRVSDSGETPVGSKQRPPFLAPELFSK